MINKFKIKENRKKPYNVSLEAINVIRKSKNKQYRK